MDKKKFNKSVGKALRTKRTELGGATAGRNGSGAVENITKQLGFKSNRSVYRIENGEGSVTFVDFILYCRAMQMSEEDIPVFVKKIIVEALTP